MIFEFAFAINLFLLLISISNFRLLRRPAPLIGACGRSIAVLVPLRNERENLPALIGALSAQDALTDISFLLIDDSSTDETFELAQHLVLHDARFSVVRAPALANGWLGKPAALEYGLLNTQSEIVVVVDADVRLNDDAINRAVMALMEAELDFVSAYPQQIARTWSEYVIQPLLQWSWMATVPLRLAEHSSRTAFCVANGQFFIAKRAALRKIDGFQAVRAAILDDIYLARALVRAGFHGTVIDGSSIASCRMYSSWKTLRDGYGKSLRLAFGGAFGTVVVIALLVLTGVVPLLGVLSGSSAGWLALATIILSRVISAISCRSPLGSTLLHPFAMILLIFLIARSWANRNHAEWKGRKV